MQVIGRELGAGWIDNIMAEVAGALDHMPFDLPAQTAHKISIMPGTQLSALAGAATARANSLHRQVIASPARAKFGLFEQSLYLPYAEAPPSISKRNAVLRHSVANRKRSTSMLDIWFAGLGLGLIGAMAVYLAILRKA